jgi:2-ketocyclohexanecarboxyl-CoA hydrolase
MQFEDLIYEIRKGVAWIIINRPDKMNAFRGKTCDELIGALYKAGYDKSVGAIVLAGAGDRAFCTGGDQAAHDGAYDGRGTIGLPMEELHAAICDLPKPVIARVQGYAIGGGNVLCTICDLTICSEKAVFGQVGPKMGSVDPGYGTAFLARVVGEKKAREMWYRAAAILGRRRWLWGSPMLACLTTSSTRKSRNGARSSVSEARPRLPSRNAASIWTLRTRPASPGWGCMR